MDLHRAGQLIFFGNLDRLAQADAFAQWLAPFRKSEWIVYAKPPFGGPEAVLAYLSRYTHRVAIPAPAWSARISMTLLAAAILIGSIGAAIAYQNAPPAMIGAFDFACVGFAVLWGLVFFAEVPDVISTLGMLLIVGAGILSLRQ